MHLCKFLTSLSWFAVVSSVPLTSDSTAVATLPGQSGSAMSIAQPSSLVDNPLVKRQPPTIRRGLSATIRVNCPQRGTYEQEFQWEAVWQLPKLTIEPRMRIDSISDLAWFPEGSNDFRALLHSSECISDAEKVCHYSFRAMTTGSIGPLSVILSLVTDGNGPGEKLVWEEYCVHQSTTTHPHQCPADYARDNTACEILNVDVAIIPEH